MQIDGITKYKCQMMKKGNRIYLYLSCIIMLFLFSNDASFAQGYTLQFNNVLLVNNALQTVPANKVWKVEKMMTGGFYVYPYNTGSCNQSNTDPYQVQINGATYFLNESLSTGQSSYQYAPGSTSGPLWLPAGTTVKTNCSNSLLSVIEFNLIQ